MVSVLVHAALLYREMPKLLHHMTLDEPEQGQNAGALAVRIAPSPSRAQPESPPPEPPPKAVPRHQPKAARPAPQAPPVIALNTRPSAPAQPAPAPAPAAPAPPQPPVAGDFLSDVEARRRANASSAPASPSPGMIASAPAETEAERARRITAANLTPKQMVFGYDPAAGGGVFQIRRMSLFDAEVAFYGWNREIKRKTMQILEVSKGNNADIRIAVVRRMIAIIRDYENDDFLWESRRLGREMKLSARQRDNAYLEDFMMNEFFPDQAVTH